MIQNPYSPPGVRQTDDESGQSNLFSDIVHQERNFRSRWTFRCWALGLVFGLLAFGCNQIATKIRLEQTPERLATLDIGATVFDILTLVSILTGIGVVVFGPMSRTFFVIKKPQDIKRESA